MNSSFFALQKGFENMISDFKRLIEPNSTTVILPHVILHDDIIG